jgi:hypothetical protein
MSLARKTYTDPDGTPHTVNVRPAVTHSVLRRNPDGGWWEWDSAGSEAGARKSATVGRLKDGTRVIVELEDVA